MSYDDIYRGLELIRKAMREGNERDKENWRKINERCEATSKTQKELIRDLCKKNRRKDEKEFNKLNDRNTPDLERAIILCKYFGIALPLALTGYEYNPFHKRRKK